MKEMAITFAIGAGVVFAAAKASAYLNTPGTDGSLPLGATLSPYAAPLAGGLLLVIAHKLSKSA